MPPPPETRAGFSALLLAGGRSSRMGRDKALLPHPLSKLPLIGHQAALLRSLPGCAELLLSAPAERAYPAIYDRRIDDALPDAGPLAGLAAGLAAAKQARVLALAVDLPFVTADLLQRLRDASTPAQGAVPRHPDGFFDPLCAVYPAGRHAWFAAALARHDFSLQHLLRTAVAEGWMIPQPLSPPDLLALANWNTPADAGLD